MQGFKSGRNPGLRAIANLERSVPPIPPRVTPVMATTVFHHMHVNLIIIGINTLYV